MANQARAFSIGSIDVDAMCKASDESYAAIKRHDWDTALSKLEWLGGRQSFDASVNRASYFLQASMCAWNLSRKTKALDLIDRSISIMRNGENLGNGCEARAVALRAKMRDGDIVGKFSSDDIQSPCGIYKYVMEVPMAQFNGSIRATIARYNALGGMFDAQKAMYEAEGRWQEKSSKFYARQEYQRATGRTFDPDCPPGSGTTARTHWDAAKRTYDIFEE
jgi:hypothetical protein